MTELRPQLDDTDVLAARRGVLYAARSYGARLTAEDIEDLTQNAILRFLEHANPAKLDHRSAYLSRIGRNCFVDSMRRQSAARRDTRLTTSLDGFDARSDVCPERECSAREELAVLLSRCRAVLSTRYLRVFVLTYINGLTGAEVAGVCGLSPTNVYSILSRARQQLTLAGIVPGPRSSCRN